jgi:hypothetical protein
MKNGLPVNRIAPDPWSPEAITAEAAPLPDRLCLYSPPKWGKTSWAAQAPDPVFLTTKGEDGIQTLKKSGLVRPEVRTYPRCATIWQDLLRALARLITHGPRPQTLVLDTLNGAEQLCQNHVCNSVYGGDWGEKGFTCFQNGYRVAAKEFERILDAFDQLRELGTAVICLAHTAVRTVKNPHGPDYDKTRPALHEATWDIAARRFDILLAGTFETIYAKAGPRDRKAKVTGGDRRIIIARPGASVDAGGRYPLPPVVDCGKCATDAWRNFQAALNRVA